MAAKPNTLHIGILRSGESIKLETRDETIRIQSNSPGAMNKDRCDFAAWLFMPIAMRRGMNIHVEGAGSEATILNARRMSEIWEAWFPERFSSVDVSFGNVSHADANPNHSGHEDLCFYSGGVDSTHANLRRFLHGKRQSLLTVHGMDYGSDDENHFLDLVRKTDPFARLVGQERLIVKTDVYGVYKKHKINMGGGGHLTHIFALAGAGFLHSEKFTNLVIAADHRLDQQFVRFPYGSNLATNPLFSDGTTRLLTESVDVSRSEKMPLLSTSREALAALTFCTNPDTKPNNCGKCKKCIRTKLMFLASIGEIPDIFIDRAVPEILFKHIDPRIKKERIFLIDLIMCAKRSGTINKIPGAELVYLSMKGSVPGKNPFTKIIDSIKNLL